MNDPSVTLGSGPFVKAGLAQSRLPGPGRAACAGRVSYSDAGPMSAGFRQLLRPAMGFLGVLVLLAGCATDTVFVSMGTDPRIVVPQQDGIPRTLVWLEQTAGTERGPGGTTAYRKLVVRGATVSMGRTPPIGPIVSISQSSAFISGPVACVGTGATHFAAWHDGTGLVGRFFDAATSAPLGSDPLLLTPEATSLSPVATHEYDVAYDSEASQVVLVYVIGRRGSPRQAWMRFITMAGRGLASVGPAIAVGTPPQASPRITVASGSAARNLVLWIQSQSANGVGPLGGAIHNRSGARVAARDGSYQFTVPGSYGQVAGVFEPNYYRFLILGDGGSSSTMGHVDGFHLALDGDVPLMPGAKVGDLVVRPAKGSGDYPISGWLEEPRLGRPKVFALANGPAMSGLGSQPVLAYWISARNAVDTSGIYWDLYDTWISTTTFPEVLAPGLPVSADRTRTVPRADMPRFFIGGGDLKPAADGQMLLFFEQLSGRPIIRRGSKDQLSTPPSLILRAFSP